MMFFLSPPHSFPREEGGVEGRVPVSHTEIKNLKRP